MRRGQRVESPRRGRKPLPDKRDGKAFAARLPVDAVPEQVGCGGRVLSCQQVGQVLGIRPREVTRLIQHRGLVGLHLGRTLGWRIVESDLWRWIDAQKRAAP